MTDAPITAEPAAASASILPDRWPDDSRVTAARPWWIPWPIAVLLTPLFWLMPGRMGPHFTAVHWAAPVLTHLAALSYAFGLFALQEVISPEMDYGEVTLSSLIQETDEPGMDIIDLFWTPLASAALVLTLAGNDPGDFAVAVGIFGLIELGFVLLALAQTPYATVGEPRRRLIARCLKLTYWSSTSVVLLGLALQVKLFYKSELFSREWCWGDNLLVALYLLFFAWLWLRSIARFPGPAEGPGFQPRTPRCESCGYQITGLRRDGICPECGTPVDASLPDDRAVLPELIFTRPIALVHGFLRVWWRMIFSRTPLKHTRVHSGHGPARRFAVLCAVTSAAMVPLLFRLIGPILAPDFYQRAVVEATEDAEGAVLCLMMLVGAITLWANLLLVSVLPVVGLPFSRNTLPRSMVSLLHAAWLIPIAVSTSVMLPLFFEWDILDRMERWIGRTGPDAVVSLAATFAVFCLMVGTVPFIAFVRQILAFKHARYANA